MTLDAFESLPTGAPGAHPGASLQFEAPVPLGGWMRLRVRDAAGEQMLFMVEVLGLGEYLLREAAIRAICAHRFLNDRDMVTGCVITAEAIAAQEAGH